MRPWRARRAPGQVGLPSRLPAEMRKMVCQRQFPAVQRTAAHPHAEAQFREIALTADRGALKRAIEAALPSTGAECRSAPGVATAPPDSVIRVESAVLMMGCPTGRQTYSIAVKWQAMSMTTSKVLGESTTRCIQASSMEVDAWSADAERARNEVNGAIARTGQRIAAELLGADKLTDCRFKADEPGESGPQ